MTTLVFCWGAVEAGFGGASSWSTLMPLRALLGLFEAGCEFSVAFFLSPALAAPCSRLVHSTDDHSGLPLFSLMTGQWYRRSEQPIRVAAWYSMNGLTTIFMALVAYGL